ncbi:MAG: hypothetical protein FD121_1, partial [Gallionellaceae bacterium]
VLLDHIRLVLDLVVDDVQRAVDAVVQVGEMPLVAAIHMREILQVLHDLLDPRDAVLRFFHQRA